MWVIKKIKNIDILIKDAEKIRSWIDYLRLNFLKRVPYFDDFLSKLDYDNSNFAVDDNDFLYVKMKMSTGPALLVSTIYNDEPVPIMLYNVFQNGIKSKYARLDFYGSYFRLEEVWFFEPFWFKWFLEEITSEDPTISRIDYCFDFFYKNHCLLPKAQSLFGKVSRDQAIYTFGRWDVVNSWAIGSKSSKRVVLRMYDKLQDISVKNKFNLYQDYLEYSSVHRFEVQYGPSFVRGFSISSLDHLLHKVLSTFDMSKLIPSNQKLFYSYAPLLEINDYNKLHYTKQFVARAKKFFESGVNPFLVTMDYFDANILKTDERRLLQYRKFLMELQIRLQKHTLLDLKRIIW